MVDAAVGGKTGVNLPEGKNLVGAFHQPGAVGCNPDYLGTLEPREFRAGLGEVVKTAWLGAPDLFERMEASPPRDAKHPDLPEIVRRCVAVKADIVSRDEREGGLRATLNFGHTLGHAIETSGAGRWLHGEAVSLGMVAAVHLSVETGRCDAAHLDRLVTLLEALGLPTRWPELDETDVWDRTRVDKKRAHGSLSWQLTQGLGLVSVARDLPEQAPRASLKFLRR
ncbi:MAG: 3-dehydroquinate synthase, partial [Gemmatimonadetes bacterium]|nr:3-dehydroquinate synthase [Gemmatimonadota bacterium]